MKLKSIFMFLSQAVAVIFAVFFFVGATFTPRALAITQADISVDVSPENPKPHENVTITLSTNAGNLDSVLISWHVNGKLVISGVGKKSFLLDSGNVNTTTTVQARISFPGEEVVQTINIRPATMVILWEANDSYVPPFYKGRALLSKGSEVKIVAMPEFMDGKKMISPKNMNFNWKQNYDNAPGGSGYGKNFFIYTDDYLDNTTNISVVATSLSQNYSSEASVSTTTTIPEIVFYKKNAVFGTDWEDALSEGYRIEGGEELVLAVPYFIAPKQLINPTLIFRWYINDQLITVENYLKNMMPLRVENGQSGTAKLRLDIENTDKIFQTATKEINVQF